MDIDTPQPRLESGGVSGPLTGKLLGNRYLIGEKLGEGGEAEVYAAWQKTAMKWVAIRFPLSQPEAVPPAVLPAYYVGWVRYWEIGQDSELGHYQVLERLDGPTLKELVLKNGQMHLFPSGRDFIVQTLNSIHRLHSHDWVHGDISAENLLFQTMADEDFRNIKMWKLLDLPFLSYFPEDRQKPLFGSLYTMAPERFEGKAADYRSDLYSLGCLYYFALKGSFPHVGSRTEIAVGHLKFEPEPLDFGPDDTLLPQWVAKIMHKKPEKRFKSAAEARAALTKIFGQIVKL